MMISGLNISFRILQFYLLLKNGTNTSKKDKIVLLTVS